MFCNLNNSAFGMKYKIVLLATFLFTIKGEIVEKNASTISIQESNIKVSEQSGNEQINQNVNTDQQEKLINSQLPQSQHKVPISPVSLFTRKRKCIQFKISFKRTILFIFFSQSTGTVYNGTNWHQKKNGGRLKLL